MKYDTRTYFKEHEADDVNGFTVVETNEDTSEYHLAEKWSRPDSEDTWLNYWIPESHLLARIEGGECEETATLSDSQFEQVFDMVDHSGVSTPAKA